jgi:hypothetical protein
MRKGVINNKVIPCSKKNSINVSKVSLVTKYDNMKAKWKHTGKIIISISISLTPVPGEFCIQLSLYTETLYVSFKKGSQQPDRLTH